DTVRRYEQALDPSAYFLTAWLPDQHAARQRGIVADYFRHPGAPENIALETMLAAAARGLQAGDYPRAEALTRDVNLVLDRVAAGDPDPFGRAPLAGEYLSLTRAALALGYEPQTIDMMDAGTARVSATPALAKRPQRSAGASVADWPALADLTFTRTGATWTLAR
ncbi:MAG: hypothetical protein HY784_18765, partial [Chloroflexi bacterium]|nr:hypothetical protein [Chloroflexota bacterium]